MTWDEFKESSERLLKECRNILETKGRSYSTRNDELQNFKELGYLLCLPPEVVCLTFLMKHITSIFSIVRGERFDTEGMRSRIVDSINYLILLNALFEEKESRLNKGG